MAFEKFFVVGCPRSGTTLLQEALGRHSRIVVPPETAFFTLIRLLPRHRIPHLRRLGEDLGIALPPLDPLFVSASAARSFYEEMARRYASRVGKTGVTHFGEKTPEHLYRLGRIRAVFPGAKVICIYRDGRDVALSLQSLPWTSKNLYVNFALWMYCCRLQRRARRQCHLPLHFVRYEDLVGEPERELRGVLDFLGLEYESQVAEAGQPTGSVPDWEYAWKGRATQPIRSDRVGLWRRELTREQVEILERWGSGELRELGYELSSGGRGALPWLFRARVAVNSLLWLARRPRYGQHKALWVAKVGDGSPGRPSREIKIGPDAPTEP